jgi:exopolysaccharide biosynthesis polyprenyl glycosylphosphotransferase
MKILDEKTVKEIFLKIEGRFNDKLDPEWIDKMKIVFSIYPETYESLSISGPFNLTLYPDLSKRNFNKRVSMSVKNIFDMFGSFTALLLFSPIFLIAAIAIKATSDGPVFYRQERLGFNGRIFSVLKFRSMYTHSDSKEHRKYIEKYIGDQQNAAVEPGVFKLNNDTRITPVGNFMRKTSIDELPQLINVLRGEMSLVGPRPPIPYECDLYDIWHKRRLLSCKPGITGLWQVTGRSRTTFDEMVRLDIKYISEWSLWLDLKILLKTPKAVLGGKGAM